MYESFQTPEEFMAAIDRCGYESQETEREFSRSVRFSEAWRPAMILLQLLPDEVHLLGGRALPGVVRRPDGTCWLLVEDRMYQGGIEAWAEPQPLPREEEPPQWAEVLPVEAPIPQRTARTL